MKNKLRTLALAGAIALAGLVGAHAEETILLGSQLPLTGKLARVGTGMHEGISVAVDMFNRQNEGKYKVELVTIDDETSPAKAVAAVEKLAGEGVVALSGGYGSNIIGPASEAANKAGLVYITSGGVAPGLSHRGHEGFFRINNTEGYSKAMMGLLKEMGVKKVSILYNNKEATTDLAKTVSKALSDQGVEVVLHAFDGGTSDFKPLINKVKLQDKPDAIGMVGYENDYVGILKAGMVLRPDVKAMVGVWSLATSKMNSEFHDLVQTVYGTSMLPYPAEFTSPEAKDFAETYQKLFGKEPDYLGQFGYVQTKLLLEAIVRAQEAGTLGSGGLAEELRGADANTLIGEVKFDENGDNPLFSHRMGQHQGDKVVLVWPKDAATGEMIFPATPWSQ
jgi:branched-chain amino acid transport system substrate-binding protein